MKFLFHGRIGRFFHRRMLARWKKAAAGVDETDLAALDVQARMAHQILRDVRKFKIAADGRLALPRSGVQMLPKPAGTDWAWRPAIWQSHFPDAGRAPALPKDSLTNEVVVFHDCRTAQVAIRQTMNTREIDLCPYGLTSEVFHFDGSYLSLVIEVPPASCDNLRKDHLIRLAAMITRERPTRIDARLNVKHGANTEQILLTLPDDSEDTSVEFDLAYSQLNESRAERMWVDLMIADPAMNKITIHDLNLCRYPRAGL